MHFTEKKKEPAGSCQVLIIPCLRMETSFGYLSRVMLVSLEGIRLKAISVLQDAFRVMRPAFEILGMHHIHKTHVL